MSHVTRESVRAALVRVIEGIESGKVSDGAGCQYVSDGDCKPCVVGLLLGPAICEEIKALPMGETHDSAPNERRIEAIAEEHLGAERIEQATGLTVQQAQALQCAWDSEDACDRLVMELKDILIAGKGTLNRVRFEV
jgi:hypothetical protein